MRLSNWKIGRKLAAAFAVVVTLMVIVGALAVMEFREIDTRQEAALAARERLDAHRGNYQKAIAELRAAAGDDAVELAEIEKAERAAEAGIRR